MEHPDMTQKERDRIIIRTSAIGVIANLLLAAAKAVTGIFAHSIAILLDAINNLTDVLSSVVTIIGTRLAGKMPDKKHPLGHGRIEYLSAMIVAAIVLYAGIASGVESVKKLLHPETPDYSPLSIGILIMAVIVKLLLGKYVSMVGKKVHSGALTASGADAFFDAVVSLSVLLCAVLFLLTHIRLEPVVGLLIAGVIIRTGVSLLMEAFDDLLGKRFDSAYLAAIRETICADSCVQGAYDLMLHSYGPNLCIGSVHVEVPDTMTAKEIDRMQRRIAGDVLKRHGVLMTCIGIYAVDLRDSTVCSMREEIRKIVLGHEGVLQLHGFYAEPEQKTASFDVIIDYGLSDRYALFRHISDDVQKAYPDYAFHITLDIDI